MADNCSKAVRSMSDLQIITGLAILSAGYASLECGISTYHWQILVYTAWFSSVTHLTAMSFLRNYLYNHQSERIWRVSIISIFILMLLLAILLSGRFEPSSTTGAGFAICYILHDHKHNDDKIAVSSISATILVLSLLTRIVKLHRRIAEFLSGRVRKRLSARYQRMVSRWVAWANDDTITGNLRRTLVVNPMVALHLAIRSALDFYSSMFFEVLWLLVSAIWGSILLYFERRTHESYNMGEDQWSFGQIVPVMMLVAPFVAIFEFWQKGKSIISLVGHKKKKL
jgi:hypothetical protein